MIKSKVISKGANSIGFPKLMKGSTGVVVLFHKPTSGVVVGESGSSYCVGHYSNTWGPDSFSDYDDAITLENSNE